jgi:hypothetical protein
MGRRLSPRRQSRVTGLSATVESWAWITSAPATTRSWGEGGLARMTVAGVSDTWVACSSRRSRLQVTEKRKWQRQRRVGDKGEAAERASEPAGSRFRSSPAFWPTCGHENSP